jgi:AcrR family transcriptional regulator
VLVVSDGGGNTEITKTNSEQAILAAALRAIIQRGSGKLTLSAVAVEAGVSRPTLYRWFPTKTHLLAAITEYEKDQFDLGLSTAIEGGCSPTAQLDAALRYLVTYLDTTMGNDPIGAEPAYALQSLGAALEPQSEALARRLGVSLAHVPAVEAGVLSEQQAAEMFLRLVFSHYLMPHPDPEVLLDALRAFAGLPPTLVEPAMESR